MINIGITGANGYIGVNLVASLSRNPNFNIFQLLRFPDSDNPHQVRFHLNDTLEESIAKLDVIVHLAYDFNGDTYAEAYEKNHQGSAALFAFAKKCGVKKIIYFSSNAAHELAKSDYGKIKFEIEKTAKLYDAVIIRPGLVYGRVLGGKLGGIVETLKKMVKNFPVLPLFGFGRRKFYPCHIQDLSYLLEYLVIADTGYENSVIVAACKIPITFKMLLCVLASSQNKKLLLIPFPSRLIYYALKITRLFKIKLGIRPDAFKTMISPNPNVWSDQINHGEVCFREFSIENIS